MISRLFLCCFLGAVFPSVFGAQKCAWVVGKLVCKKNPDAAFSAELRLLDRDGPKGHKAFKVIDELDKDDLMGFTIPEEDGTFLLQGCGDDHDWLPFLKNYPEPYVQIFHFCNSDDGEEVNLDEFKVFVPDIYKLGTIELDN